MRHLVANNIHKLIHKQNTYQDRRKTTRQKMEIREGKLIYHIKKKITDNKLIITKADKGNTLVILQKDVYNEKVKEFMIQNNFTKLTHDITSKQQRTIRSSLNKCKDIINRDTKWKYVNMNPSAPHIFGLIKLHKPQNPIRPIVNWKDSPSYKLAKFITSRLKDITQLPNIYNVQNSINLIENLNKN
jgi:hypothetical protein